MFHEAIGRQTAEHLRSHIEGYLTEIDTQFTGTQKAALVLPKGIEYASQVGGMIEEFDNILPQYGIDIPGKIRSQTNDNLIDYEYGGQINGLLSAGSRDSVDLLVSRHAAAVETFIKRHLHFHQFKTDNFSVLEFVFLKLDFSGAEYLGDYNDRQVWIGGFSLDCSWFVSEEGEGDA